MPTTHIYFFDTSALLKLLISEPGSEKAWNLFGQKRLCYTSWVLLGEALGVLKHKHQLNALGRQDYCESVELLFNLLRKRKLRTLDLASVDGQPELLTYNLDLQELLKKYPRLDAADLLQFAAIRQSYIRATESLKLAILVTADKKLAKAALSEGIESSLVNKDE